VTIGGVSDTFTTTTVAKISFTPKAFHFVNKTNVVPNTQIVSNAVVISGINTSAQVNVLSGGEYSIGCTGTFTSAQGTILNGQKICVRRLSSISSSTAASMTLTIGLVSGVSSGVTGSFTVTTAASGPAADSTPTAFRFTDKTNAALNAPQVSNTVTIGGINVGAPISVSGGDYSIGCDGVFTTGAGTIFGGQTVCVRHTSSTAPGIWTDTTLTVGGVSDTFSSVTSTAPQNTP
jgi:hypothetical protein